MNSSLMKKVIIVGGVAGGATAAARLRRLAEQAQIILFERGKYISYANCGLPYHVGDVIKRREALLLMTPEDMKAKYNVDVQTEQEVIAIDREAMRVTVRTMDGETYQESYDALLLSTGSSPLVPPIPGLPSDKVMTLWTVPDADRIRRELKQREAKSAIVVGGGFIGLEMAENLRHAGLSVSLVEMGDQVMAPLDYEMAQLVEEHLTENGIRLHLSDGVSSFEEEGDSITAVLTSGQRLVADLCILSIGVKPNSILAQEAGLPTNERGGILVDENLRTRDPNIFAVGDVIEVRDFISGQPAMIPLAGPANKQGRIAADQIAAALAQGTSGASDKREDPSPEANLQYAGTQGTSIAKIFDLTVASTGASEKALMKRGLRKGPDYESILITQNSHAGYYPGASPMTLKLLYTGDGGRILGAQIVGYEGVDKRIDVLAAVLRLGGGVQALKELELAYAPPYSSAKDPVNMAGFTAENQLTGRVVFADWDAVEKADPNRTVLLDVREDGERMAFSLSGALAIPLGQLRSSLSEIPKDKEVITFCAIGVRSYNAARILMQHGYSNVKLYPGGTRFYRSTHYREALNDTPPQDVGGSSEDSLSSASAAPSAAAPVSPESSAPLSLDCSGLQCPGPIMKVFEAMKDMEPGQELQVSASDPGFTRDIEAWCRRTGNVLVSKGKGSGGYAATLRKGGRPVSAEAAACPAARASLPPGKTMVVFSGDLDRALASLIIANGAAAMGRPVTMFFTFWGLNILRRPEGRSVKKSFTEAMFSRMMPKGTRKLKLSKMNMGGMGTKMMRKVMKDKNVDSLEELLQKAMDAGVKLVACTMSMDVMGIREEELIDGVSLGGVASYLGDAEEADMNLFI